MTKQITRAMIDALGFDIDGAIAAFTAARAAHAETEGEPAPQAHPLVEQIVAGGEGYEIIEPPAIPPLSLSAYAAQLRKRIEAGGLTLPSGVRVQTDPESQSKLGNTIFSIDLGLIAEPVNWKSASGFVSLTRADLVDVAGAVAAFVQALFNIEMAVRDAIEAGTITDEAGVNAAFAAFG